MDTVRICSLAKQQRENIDLIIEKQLSDTGLWRKCVDVFSSGIDNTDAGWRGEYWGKMMRGACLVYSVTHDERLYGVLTDAVEGLLSKQEPSGRISSYRDDDEFHGWDMWSRKYVMTGLQHYLDICRDEAFKSRVMTALCRHADYIIEHVGKGKLELLQTSVHWGGVNSASILEPFVRLYRDTKQQKYLDYAGYIFSAGGCLDGSLIDCALQGLPPYRFPEQKAYETMSFFEGALAYYEVTGEKKALDAVCRFTESLLETDVTVIGSCGCTHELFDHSAVMQTEINSKIMQETCVTVTLMRLLSRLFAVTGEKRLADTVRLSYLNALCGALNKNGYDQYSNEKKKIMKGMIFDSYSPLCQSKRGLAIGGFKEFADGSHFGCCACIASAGFAVYPLTAVTPTKDGVRINYLVDGKYAFGDAALEISGEKITVSAPEAMRFSVAVTTGDEFTSVEARCAGRKAKVEGGYTLFSGDWSENSEILLNIKKSFSEKKLNGKASFRFGDHVLAADASKTGDFTRINASSIVRDENGEVVYTLLTPQADEQVRVSVKTADGELILTDYASAGQDGVSLVSVWF